MFRSPSKCSATWRDGRPSLKAQPFRCRCRIRPASTITLTRSASAIFFNHGQCCCAGSRLFVERPVFDRVVEGVAAKAKKIRVGSGMEPDTSMGPLVSEEQLQRVCNYLEIGLSEGATAVAGGKKLGDKGYFFEPTGLVNTKDKMRVGQEGIFGPG